MNRIAAHLHLPKLKRGDSACISIKPRVGPTYYAADVKMIDVVFKVNENGRQRVLRRKQREVHAWVTGVAVDTIPAGVLRECTYNPYKTSTFVDRHTGAPVLNASFVHMVGSKVYYTP